MTPEDSMEPDDEAREAGIAMLKEGEATPAEISRLAGVTRQAVYKWQAEIDVDAARDSWLKKAWSKRLGKVRAKKPSSKERREFVESETAAYLAKGGRVRR